MSTKLAILGTKALVGAAVLGQMLSFSSQANATAYAYSALEVSSFIMNNEFGGFSSFTFTSQPLSASLNATNASTIQLVSNTEATGTNQSQITLGSTAFAADNSYFGANRPTLLNPTGNFAVADSHQTNVVILGGTGGNFGTQSGSQVSGGSDGAASTGTLNSLSWTFNVSAAELAATGGVMDLIWTSETLRNVRAETTAAGETARATLNMSIDLFRGSTRIGHLVVFDELVQIAVGPDAGGSLTEDPFSENGAFVITATGNYTFTINYDSSTQVASVALPEPGTLGLIGLGLLGLGGAAHRRKRAA